MMTRPKIELIETEIAKKAARWWADKLRSPKMPDNGDKSETGMLTSMLASMAQKQHPDELIEKFESELAGAIASGDEKRGCFQYGNGGLSIGVDYHPDIILDEAAKVVGIDLGMSDLPWKTSMLIQKKRIFVSDGYQASSIELD